MKSHKKLELSKETLRHLTSELSSDKLVHARGGNESLNTCLHDCLTPPCFAPTWVDPDCWQTR